MCKIRDVRNVGDKFEMRERCVGDDCKIREDKARYLEGTFHECIRNIYDVYKILVRYEKEIVCVSELPKDEISE